jgi:hypothetical protein
VASRCCAGAPRNPAHSASSLRAPSWARSSCHLLLRASPPNVLPFPVDNPTWACLADNCRRELVAAAGRIDGLPTKPWTNQTTHPDSHRAAPGAAQLRSRPEEKAILQNDTGQSNVSTWRFTCARFGARGRLHAPRCGQTAHFGEETRWASSTGRS